jgi:CheY-like chemotaxis protein
VKILIIEDDELVQEMVARILAREFDAPSIEFAASAPKAVALLQHDVSYDLIVSDFNLKAGTGGDVLAWIRCERPTLVSRFIFFSSAMEPYTLHDKVIRKGFVGDLGKKIRALLAE